MSQPAAAGAGGAAPAAPYAYNPYPPGHGRYNISSGMLRAPSSTTVLSPLAYSSPPAEPIVRTAPINWGGAGPMGPTGYLSAMGGTTPGRAPGPVSFGENTIAEAAANVERSRATKGSVGLIFNRSTGYEGSKYPKGELRERAFVALERNQTAESAAFKEATRLSAENARRRAEYLQANPGVPLPNAAAAAVKSLFTSNRKGGRRRRRKTRRSKKH